MEEVKPQLSLYQKLLIVRKAIPYIQKNTDGHKYKYVKESVLLGIIKEHTDAQNIWCTQDVISCTPLAMGLMVTIKYTWIDGDNPSDTIVFHHSLSEPGFTAKAFGSILTYSNKYMMFKFFSVPMDNDDPDKFKKSIAHAAPNNRMSDEQISEIEKRSALLDDLLDDILEQYDADELSELDAREYQPIMHIISLKEKNERKKLISSEQVAELADRIAKFDGLIDKILSHYNVKNLNELDVGKYQIIDNRLLLLERGGE